MESIYKKIVELQSRNQSIAVCIVVNTRGSTPRKTGAKMLVDINGNITGTIGGGDLEKSVIENALKQLAEGTPKLFRHDLVHHHGMCCGGTVEIFIEPIMRKNRLYIFGAGHTGQALAKYAVGFEFEIFMMDERKDYISNCTNEKVNKLNLPHQEALQALPFDDATYICIMTHSHPYDRDILAYCINRPHAYLGMIGSRRKVEMTKKMFLDSGITTPAKIETVDMPMGFDIGAEGPEEIALSIITKLVAVKNRTLSATEKNISKDINEMML